MSNKTITVADLFGRLGIDPNKISEILQKFEHGRMTLRAMANNIGSTLMQSGLTKEKIQAMAKVSESIDIVNKSLESYAGFNLYDALEAKEELEKAEPDIARGRKIIASVSQGGIARSEKFTEERNTWQKEADKIRSNSTRSSSKRALALQIAKKLGYGDPKRKAEIIRKHI